MCKSSYPWQIPRGSSACTVALLVTSVHLICKRMFSMIAADLGRKKQKKEKDERKNRRNLENRSLLGRPEVTCQLSSLRPYPGR